MSCHWSHITKNCLDWGSNSRPGNVKFEMGLELLQQADRLNTRSNHVVKEFQVELN